MFETNYLHAIFSTNIEIFYQLYHSMYGMYDIQENKYFVHIIEFMKPKNLISQPKYIIYISQPNSAISDSFTMLHFKNYNSITKLS